jgi:uncharacterized membrane protein YcfT
VLVTLIHATDWIQETSIRIPGWVHVNEVLSTLRMPLFFVCAGILAAKWVTVGWGELVPRKVAFLALVYLIWQPVGSLAALIATRFNGDELTLVRMLGSLALTPVRPRFELWFLWALALFFVLARASARLPRTPQLVVAAGIAAVWFSTLVPETNLGWDGSAKYYVFFLLGCYHRPHLEGFVEHLGFEASLLLIGGWFLLAAVAETAGIDHLPGVGLLVRLVGVAAGFALARRLVSVTLLSYLGSRTLPIYLAHTPLIICFTWVLSMRLGDGLPDRVIAVLPVLFTVVSIALSLLLHSALTSNSVGALWYAPPAAVVGWTKRLFSGRRQPPAPRVIDLRTPAPPRRTITMTEVPVGPRVAELEPQW